MDKRAIIDALSAKIDEEIAAAARAAKDAAAAATHEEAKPENDKDTRGLEQSYLARGQAERVRELEQGKNALKFMVVGPALERVALGALVTTECDGQRALLFVAPFGGGMRVRVDGVEVQAITPESPLGRALLGKEVGDVAELRTRTGKREHEIVAVR